MKALTIRGSTWVKITLSIVLFLLLVATGVYVWLLQHQNHLKATREDATLLPQLERVEVRAISVSEEHSEIHFKILLRNNFPFRLKADQLTYTVFVEDTLVVQNINQLALDISPDSSQWIELKTQIEKATYESFLQQARTSGNHEVIFKLVGSTTIHAGPLSKKIKFNKSETVALFFPPKSYVERTKMKKVQIKKGKLQSEVDLVIKIVNENTFPIQAEDVSFTLKIYKGASRENNAYDTFESSFPGTTEIPPQDTLWLKANDSMPLGQILSLFITTISNPEKLHYALDVKFNSKIDHAMFPNTAVVIKSTGTLNELSD